MTRTTSKAARDGYGERDGQREQANQSVRVVTRDGYAGTLMSFSYQIVRQQPRQPLMQGRRAKELISVYLPLRHTHTHIHIDTHAHSWSYFKFHV